MLLMIAARNKSRLQLFFTEFSAVLLNITWLGFILNFKSITPFMFVSLTFYRTYDILRLKHPTAVRKSINVMVKLQRSGTDGV